MVTSEPIGTLEKVTWDKQKWQIPRYRKIKTQQQKRHWTPKNPGIPKTLGENEKGEEISGCSRVLVYYAITSYNCSTVVVVCFDCQ